MAPESPVLVSIIVPMKNPGRFLRACIDSLLIEADVSLEVVVVDDGSTDGSQAIVLERSDPRVRMIAGPQTGIANALNLGFTNARGEILMRCDADDLYPAGRIRWQIEWLSAHPEIAAVCGSYITIDQKGRIVTDLISSIGQQASDITEELHNGLTRTHMCTFAMRRSNFLRVGGFRPDFETAEDIDFQLRFAENGKIHYLPKCSYFYRLHDASITHQQANVRRTHFESLARELQQERVRTGTDRVFECVGLPPPGEPIGGERHSANDHIQQMLIGSAWQALPRQGLFVALSIAWRATLTQPNHPSGWKCMFMLLAKGIFRRKALNSRNTKRPID